MLNTRFKRCAQVIDARRSAGVWSGVSSQALTFLPLPRLAGVTRARYLLFGALCQPPDYADLTPRTHVANDDGCH